MSDEVWNEAARAAKVERIKSVFVSYFALALGDRERGERVPLEAYAENAAREIVGAGPAVAQPGQREDARSGADRSAPAPPHDVHVYPQTTETTKA